MSEDLVLELETAAPVAGSLENIENLVRVVVREVGWAVEGMKGSALAFGTPGGALSWTWPEDKRRKSRRCRRLLSAFEKRLGLLKQTHAVATWLHKPGGAEVPDPDVLV